MQLVPRYLVKNKINIISDDAGLLTEYRPVYQRTIKISRGINNVIQFKLLNADQKPVTVTQTPVFVVFDDDIVPAKFAVGIRPGVTTTLSPVLPVIVG